MRRLVLNSFVAVIATVAVAPAATIISCIPTGPSTITAACNQQQTFVYSLAVDWGAAFGPADGTTPAGGWTAQVGGMGVTLSAGNDLSILRADNTLYAWSGTGWTLAAFMPGFPTTFDGHFGAPSTPTSTPPLGDNLVGVSGTGPFNIALSQAVNAIGFSLSTRVQLDFLATVTAYDVNNLVLGSVSVATAGGGGQCPGLADADGPAPCNDAPYVAILDSLGQIKRISISTSDAAGFYVSALYVDQAAPAVPEPGTASAIGLGLVCLLLVAGRRYAFALRFRR